MARVLGRTASTVSRKLGATPTQGLPYLASTAHTLASARALASPNTQALGSITVPYVQTQLTQGCSPEQIAGRLQRAYPDDMRTQLSAVTIDA
ncbi:MAG: hypothetical protein ABIU05_19110 [Nitrospirales bacterium]